MTPERHQQIGQLFNAALELEAGQRAAFLAQACAGDEALRREVESLLASHEQAAAFIAAPALAVAAKGLAEAPTPTVIGQRIGHYQILSLLGAGGMGEVYLAEDQKLRRKVALKLLPARFTQDAERVRRFEQEARAASALNHPNILTIHEIGQADGRHYLVTEFIDGQTLRQQMRSARLKLSEALEVAVQVASALAAAHEAGIVHRDVKPENLMLRRDGYIKVLDFGLAKLTEPPAQAIDTQALTAGGFSTEIGVVMGTVLYMSPEQARGQTVDARTDIFSLGVVLYELITGRAPFEGATSSDVIAALLGKEPLPLTRFLPEIPVELERIVTKALRKDREERYQTIRDLFLDLKDLKQDLELQAQVARARQPDASGGGTAQQSISQERVETAPEPASPFAELGRTTSGAEYPIKTHKHGTLFALATVLLKTGRRSWWTVAAAIVALAVVSLLLMYRGSRRDDPLVTLLAVVPFSAPEGDAEAASIGRTFLYSLPQVLAAPRLEILSSTYLTDRAKLRGIKPGTLDSATGAEVAREAGAHLIVVGTLERAGEGLTLHCELIDATTGRLRASKDLLRVSRSAVRDHIHELATTFQAALGLPAAEAGLATLSSSPIALRELAEGFAAAERMNWPAAQAHFKAAVEADPEFALAQFHHARALAWMEEETGFAEAESILSQAIRDPRRLSKVDYEKAELLLELVRSRANTSAPGYLARARKLAEDRPRDKDAVEIWMEFASHHLLEGSSAEAIQASQALVALDPHSGSAHGHLMGAAIYSSKEKIARQAAENLLRTSGEMPEILALWYLGRTEEARMRAEALGRMPRSRADKYVAIFVLFDLGDAGLVETLTRQGPNSDQEYFYPFRASALLSLGRFTEARSLLEGNKHRFLEVRGSTDPSMPALLRFQAGLEPFPAVSKNPLEAPMRAGWLARKGNPDEAERILSRIPPSLSEAPSVRRLAKWAKGEIAVARGLITEAVEHFSSGAPSQGEVENLRVASFAPFLVERAGRALLEAGRFEEAERRFRRFEEETVFFRFSAASSDSLVSEIRAWYGLGRCREATRDREGALRYYAKFLSRWSIPDNAAPEIEDALRRYAALSGKPWKVA